MLGALLQTYIKTLNSSLLCTQFSRVLHGILYRMEIYLVGGAVRDALLDQKVLEKDWVVVGAQTEEMLKRGFKQVGKQFPVFIHPKTNEEYALARTEYKTSHGYHGFKFDTSPSISLEADLKRRDLTINAIAQDKNGVLIDPWGGSVISRHVYSDMYPMPSWRIRLEYCALHALPRSLSHWGLGLCLRP